MPHTVAVFTEALPAQYILFTEIAVRSKKCYDYEDCLRVPVKRTAG